MYLALTNSLGKNGGATNDPDAVAYVAAVRAAGVPVSSSQKGAINEFYKTAKSGGYYTSLKRMYLPIWGSAAANAICMISGTSGTFNGSVTHAAGYVQGDGATGYFTADTSATAVGITTTSGLAGVVAYSSDTRNALKCLLGTRNDDSLGSVLIYQTDSSNILGAIGRSVGGAEPQSTLATTPSGVILANRNPTDLQVHRRSGSTFFSGSEETSTANTITSVNQRFMALWETTSFFHTDAKIGAMFMGTGLSDTTAQTFSLALKNLWEQTTGLTLT